MKLYETWRAFGSFTSFFVWENYRKSKVNFITKTFFSTHKTKFNNSQHFWLNCCQIKFFTHDSKNLFMKIVPCLPSNFSPKSQKLNNFSSPLSHPVNRCHKRDIIDFRYTAQAHTTAWLHWLGWTKKGRNCASWLNSSPMIDIHTMRG